MKITPTQYAQSLYNSTKGKSQGEIDSSLRNFVGILGKKNQLKLKNKIIEKFDEIYNRENGIVEAKIISREKLSSELVDKLISFVKEKYNAKNVSFENKVDKAIKGGVIVRVGNEILDGSVERKLRELKKVIVK